LKKNKELNLEILLNGKKYTFFYVLLQILFNYSKNKAKFLVGENKYVCGIAKLYEYLALNAIPIFKFVSL